MRLRWSDPDPSVPERAGQEGPCGIPTLDLDNCAPSLNRWQAVGRKFENGDIDVEIAQRADAHRDALNAIKITRRR